MAKDTLPGLIPPLVWSVNVPVLSRTWVDLIEEALGPGDDCRSEPHSRGTRELLTVLDGMVVVSVAGREYQLGPGDAVRFRGDVAHGYRNPDLHSLARFALTVFQPGVGEEGPA